MVFNPLDPKHKVAYANRAPVQIALYGDPNHLVTGVVVGIFIKDIVDYYAVELDTFLPDHPYKVISVQHTFMRPMGSNEPFLCERVLGR